MTAFDISNLTNGWSLAAMATVVSLAFLWLPLFRGVSLFVRARTATREVEPGEIAEQRQIRAEESQGEVDIQTLALLLDRVESESLRESEGQTASAFVRDASRQYVVNEYESRYADPLSMYANILPPIGFVGTTIGLVVLFLSMNLASDSLHFSALALALSSSIFALLGYATLEGLRIHLYGRLQRCLDCVP